jgi:hypothetical protein
MPKLNQDNEHVSTWGIVCLILAVILMIFVLAPPMP